MPGIVLLWYRGFITARYFFDMQCDITAKLLMKPQVELESQQSLVLQKLPPRKQQLVVVKLVNFKSAINNIQHYLVIAIFMMIWVKSNKLSCLLYSTPRRRKKQLKVTLEPLSSL